MVISNYELKTAGYQGPIEKLAELIEEKKLAVTEVSLAEVTADFLSHMETLEAKLAGEAGVQGKRELAGILADFLVVASRLVLIKSKALIPSLPLTHEEEESIRDLEVRVRLYRELKETQRYVKEGWRDAPQMGTRELLRSETAIFYPPPRIAPVHLAETAARLAGELARLAHPLRTVRSAVIHLKEKIEEIFARVKEGARSFGELRNGRSRGEAVVLFLALLHLIKSQLVRAAQESHFSDIDIAKRASEVDNDVTS